MPLLVIDHLTKGKSIADDTHQLLLAIDPIILLLSLGVVAVVATRHLGLSPIVGYLAIGFALRAAGHTVFRNSNTIEVLSELGQAPAVGHRGCPRGC